MKKLVYLLLFILPLNSFAEQKNIIITGKVYEPQTKTIVLRVNNLFKEDDIVYTKRLNKNGNFTFAYDQLYPHDNYINYNDKIYKYFAAPGDSIHVVIKNNSIVFTGSNDTLNNEIQTFKIKGLSDLFSKVNKAQKELSPMQYKEEIMSIQSESDSLMKASFKQHNSSQALQEWIFYYYRNKTIYDLMCYKWSNPEKVIPNEYYNFLNESSFLAFPYNYNPEINATININSFNTRAFMCSKANDAVDEVFIHLREQTRKANPDMKGLKDFKRFYEILINDIVQATDGTIKEILLVKLFNQMMKWKQFGFVEDNLSVFFKEVENENLRSIIIDEYQKKKKRINSDDLEQYLSYYSNNTIITSVIDSILTQNESKVIYIDFWATWCAPCIGEMPNSNALKSYYRGKDIAFVYLGVRSPEKEWKEKIEELNIDGKHYLLNDDEFNILSEIFQIDGIPHYVLINKEGKIVEKSAREPSDEYVKIQIDKELNE